MLKTVVVLEGGLQGVSSGPTVTRILDICYNRMSLERTTKEGNSPVGEITFIS